MPNQFTSAAERFGLGVVVLLIALMPIVTAACGDEEVTRSETRDQPSQERTYVSAITVSEPEPEPIVTVLQPEEPVESESSVISERPEEVSHRDAESVFLDKRYWEALELFTIYTESRPQNSWGFYMLGLSAWKAGEHDRAEEAFEKALELDPGHVKSLLNLSRVLLETNRPDYALTKIEEALELNPESNVGIRLRGRAYRELGRTEEAIDSYRKAILMDECDAWSMNNLGLIFIEEERFEEALPPLARAVELRGDVAIFQNNLGMALERTGYFRAAQEAYKSTLAIDDSHEKAYVNLGRVEQFEEEVTQEPVDLADLAQSFVDEVEGWREAVAHVFAPEIIEVDSTVTSPSDSVEVGKPESGTGEEEKGGV